MDEFGIYDGDRTYFAHYHRENSSGPERGKWPERTFMNNNNEWES